MIILKSDNGSHTEIEEMGNGVLRVRFQDGITRQVGETTVHVDKYPGVSTFLYRSKVMLEDLRKGTPGASEPIEVPEPNGKPQ